MQIQSGQEALYVACEMERGAIRTYERALMMVDSSDKDLDALKQKLMMILSDEREHLRQFQSMYTGLDTSIEQQLTLSAVAADVLFPGGLMGAVRQGMLKNQESLLRFAMDAEQKATETYRAFADACEDPGAADTLRRIAGEEESHQKTLQGYL